MESQIRHYENKLAFEMDPADLFEALEKQEAIVIIDTRKPFGYDKEHIPTSVNLPHAQMSEETTKSFDRSKLYVCYCDGIGCNGSTKGALNMTKLGFNVKELIGGIEWWKKDGYATAGTHGSQGLDIQCAC